MQESKQSKLQKLKTDIDSCMNCGLYKDNNSVFDNGSLNSRIMLIAEAPGKDECEQGRPLVGRSGKLIDECLSHVNLSRSDIWVANCLCHRPPANRNPTPYEIAACSEFLNRQIDIIKPSIIVAFGKFSCKLFLDTDEPMYKIVNKWYINEGNGSALYTMMHPSFCLRGGITKDEFKKGFEDIVRGPL